jgi:hypothetical protein
MWTLDKTTGRVTVRVPLPCTGPQPRFGFVPDIWAWHGPSPLRQVWFPGAAGSTAAAEEALGGGESATREGRERAEGQNGGGGGGEARGAGEELLGREEDEAGDDIFEDVPISAGRRGVAERSELDDEDAVSDLNAGYEADAEDE